MIFGSRHVLYAGSGWFNVISNFRWSAKIRTPFGKSGFLTPTIELANQWDANGIDLDTSITCVWLKLVWGRRTFDFFLKRSNIVEVLYFACQFNRYELVALSHYTT
jgi:hypothetical protein